MKLLYFEEVDPIPMVSGDQFRIPLLEILIVGTVTIHGYYIWEGDDGRCWLSLDYGNSYEDGPYYPVLVRGNITTMPRRFHIEAVRVCLLPMYDSARCPSVLTL
jgi:hypothetical protein